MQMNPFCDAPPDPIRTSREKSLLDAVRPDRIVTSGGLITKAVISLIDAGN